MREPRIRVAAFGMTEFVPYSQAPSGALHFRTIHEPSHVVSLEGGAGEFYSPEFRRLYAALLLKERGQ